MEIYSNQNLSVDFLLSAVDAGANSVHLQPATEQWRFLQTARHIEVNAVALGDTGSTLVKQVENYLAEAADDLQRFAAIVQQLGDNCLDHTVEHEMQEETHSTENHAHHSGMSAGESHNHAHAPAGVGKSKKRKTKRKRRNSLLDRYIQRLKR